MAEFRFDINARNNASPELRQLRSELQSLETAARRSREAQNPNLNAPGYLAIIGLIDQTKAKINELTGAIKQSDTAAKEVGASMRVAYSAVNTSALSAATKEIERQLAVTRQLGEQASAFGVVQNSQLQTRLSTLRAESDLARRSAREQAALAGEQFKFQTQIAPQENIAAHVAAQQTIIRQVTADLDKYQKVQEAVNQEQRKFGEQIAPRSSLVERQSINKFTFDQETAGWQRVANAQKASTDEMIQNVRRFQIEETKASRERFQLQQQLAPRTPIAFVTDASGLHAVEASMERLNSAGRRMATTWGLNRIGMLELEAAGVNTFQALAAGMNPFHVAVMETAQVMGALVQGGLIPSTAIVSALQSPVTALVAGVGALTAAFAYLGYQQAQNIQNSAEVRAQLIAIGEGAKLSNSDLMQWRAQLQESFGLTRTESYEVTTAFGGLVAKMGDAGKAFANLAVIAAKLPGAKFDDVLKKWTQAAEGGAAGVNKLSESMRANTERTREHYLDLDKAGKVTDTFKQQTRDLQIALEEQGGVLVRNSATWKALENDMGLVGGTIMKLVSNFADLGKVVVGGPTQVPSSGGVGVGAGVAANTGEDFLSKISKNNADLGHLNVEFRRRLNEWLGTLTDAERASLRIGPKGAFADSDHAADSLHYSGTAIDIGGMSASAMAKLRAAKLAQNAAAIGDMPHIEPMEIPSVDRATKEARANAGRAFAAANTGGVARETADQAAITRNTSAQLKVERDINLLLKEREGILAGIGDADPTTQGERQRAADNIEQRLRSMHTPAQEEAHRLTMANLEVEMKKAEEAAQRDISLRGEVTEVQKRMALETHSYLQGAATEERGFTAKATSEAIAAADRVRVAKINEARGTLEAQLHANDMQRAAVGNDAAAQMALAEQRKQIYIKSGIALNNELWNNDQELVRLRVSANQQSFQDFMQAKQNEIREAKGSATQIQAIIEEMRAKAAATYENMPRDYKRAMEEIERIQIDATQRSVQARITEANRSSQIDQIKISEEKRRLDQAVTNRTMTAQAALQAEANIIRQKAAIEEESLNKILADTKTNAEQRKTVEFELLQLKERTAQRIEDVNKRIAEANERDLKKNAESYKQFFSSIGSAAESYFEAAIMRTSTFADANRSLLRSVGKAALNLVGDVASKSIAGKLGGKAGEGVSDVLSRMLLTSLGLNTAATSVNTAASTTQTAASVANTTSQVAGTATNTVATGVNTTAIGANTAAQGTGAAASGFGSIFKAIPFIGGLFAKGGIVPSAAGGMIVGGSSGGVLSILHPREMVLPENISRGMQNMIDHGSPTSNSAVVNYNANVTGYHPYSSRASFEGLLRQHGNAMLSHVNNAVRNGWRG